MLTPTSQRQRKPVHIIFNALLVLSAALVAHSLWEPVTVTEGTEFWLGLGRLPLVALEFAPIPEFDIRWADQWSR